MNVRALHEDQRGAVMLLGLFMSCFLIGGLWFLIGIGDALVFRQIMQEAPDHAGFTSAALHAKGMNFVALCNTILLVMTTVYIVLGIAHDFTAVAAVMTVGFGAGAFFTAKRLWYSYFNFMKPIARVVHVTEEVSAYGAPWLGLAAGARVGANYGKKATNVKRNLLVLPLGSSLVPGRVGSIKNAAKDVVQAKADASEAGKNILNMFGVMAGHDYVPLADKKGKEATGTKNVFGKYGLPLEAKLNNDVCEKVGGMPFDLIGASGKGGLKGGNFVREVIAKGVKYRYCAGFDFLPVLEKAFGSLGRILKIILKPIFVIVKAVIGTFDPSFDKFWEEEGPLYVWGQASNGSVWMQIWSVNLRPRFGTDGQDASYRYVGMASQNYGAKSLVGQGAPKPSVYFSQSEFYYDCTASWEDADCNGDEISSSASYTMRWTSRLTAVNGDVSEAVGGLIGGVLGGALDAFELENVPPWTNDLFNMSKGLLGDMLGTGTDGALGQAIAKGIGADKLNFVPYH